ncbi:hypothetical protein [Nocardia sp. NPDC051570]|uniref:hypothetical protein n=1 Tax=Nocardia sp. NPDC051570 TaxID=3364324 RepID=UPI0037AB81FD
MGHRPCDLHPLEPTGLLWPSTTTCLNEYGWPKTDGAYAGKLVTWAKDTLGYTIEIVERSDDATGFEVIPRRSVAERTLAWIFQRAAAFTTTNGSPNTTKPWSSGP